MAGSAYDFEVRPPVLAGYAETLRAAAADLAAVGEALGRVRVERGWFGKLPQSGFLADRYAGHRETELAAVGELGEWAADAAEGLRGSAGRYSEADRVVADVVAVVEAGLGRSQNSVGETGLVPGTLIGEIGEPGGALG